MYYGYKPKLQEIKIDKIIEYLVPLTYIAL